MLKVEMHNYEQYLGKVGGGFRFVDNFLKYFEVGESQVVFLPNPMQVDIEKVDEAQATGKKVILRCDNIPELKNNRGCSVSKLKNIIPKADYIIYQSEWSKEKYKEFCELNDIKKTNKEKVIYNGADTSIFYAGTPDENNYIYVHGKGDNKRWPEAQEIFRRIYYKNRKAMLHIVGNLALENRDYNFGFYNGETYRFYGVQNPQGLSDIMRLCTYIIYPAFGDSCPNTLIEALTAGLEPIGLNPYGGQKEVYELFRLDPVRFQLDYMINEYRKIFKEYE